MKTALNISIGRIIFLFFVLLAAFVFVYPLYFTFIGSFKNNVEIWGTMFSLPETWRVENYVDAITYIKIGRAITNSLFVSITATVVLSCVATLAGYVMARRILRFADALYIYFLAGLMIPIHSLLLPVVNMVSKAGMRDSLPAMVIIYIALNMPITTFLITGYIKGIPASIDESAQIDGCGLFTLVFKIIVPMAMPGISTAAIIGFLQMYNELMFATTLLINKSKHTISVALLYLKGERFTSFGPIFASILLSIFPMLIIYIILQEKVESGLSAGALKE